MGIFKILQALSIVLDLARGVKKLFKKEKKDELDREADRDDPER